MHERGRYGLVLADREGLMTIGNRILAAVGALIFTMLCAQSLITSRMVDAELRDSVRGKIDTEAQGVVQALDNLLLSTTADLTIMSANRAIENYLTYRSFEDDEGMTESVSELELFMTRVVAVKPQYSRIQFVDRDGAVLQLDNGTRVERYDNYDNEAMFRRFENGTAVDGARIAHSVRSSGEGNVLVSVVGIVSADNVEGLIWLEQGMDEILAVLFADAEKNGLSVAISNDTGAVAAKQPGLSADHAGAMVSDDVPDWILISEELPQLGWRVIFGIAEARAFEFIKDLRLVSMMVFAISIVICGIVLFILVRAITRPLRRIIAAMEDVAEGDGDLTKRLDSQGPKEVALLANAFNRFSEKLGLLITEVMDSLARCSEVVERTAESAARNSTSIEAQDAQVDELARAIEQLSTTVRNVAQNASRAAEATGMADQRVSFAVGNVQRLSDETENVGEVLGVIHAIAGQTNLLALNAAIEAARAGEHGRGFAVVAEEVRRLAGNTRNSTEKINAIIENLQTGAREVKSVMSKGGTDGSDTARRASAEDQSGGTITEAVATINEMNSHIAASTEEHSAATDEMQGNILNIRSMTRQSAEDAQRIEHLSDEMEQLVRQLAVLMQQFKVKQDDDADDQKEAESRASIAGDISQSRTRSFDRKNTPVQKLHNAPGSQSVSLRS